MLRNWLDVPLHGDLLRARNKFIADIQTRLNVIEENRQLTLRSFAEKDKKGEPIIENGIYKIPDEKKADFIKDYNDTYLQETVEIEAPTIALKTILMEKMTKGLGIEDGKVFEEILECLSIDSSAKRTLTGTVDEINKLLK